MKNVEVCFSVKLDCFFEESEMSKNSKKWLIGVLIVFVAIPYVSLVLWEGLTSESRTQNKAPSKKQVYAHSKKAAWNYAAVIAWHSLPNPYVGVSLCQDEQNPNNLCRVDGAIYLVWGMTEVKNTQTNRISKITWAIKIAYVGGDENKAGSWKVIENPEFVTN